MMKRPLHLRMLAMAALAGMGVCGGNAAAEGPNVIVIIFAGWV
jgi:ABC-type glycerol-3-phosphate transport system substrate-binding protein